MTAAVCAWCEVFASMTIHGRAAHEYTDALGLSWAQQTFSCNHCRKLSIASTVYDRNSLRFDGDDPSWWEPRDIFWTPKHASGKKFPDVPEHIASAADEAYQCRSIKGFRSAILLARSVIEATAKDFDITKGTLASKIDEMHAAHHIRTHTKEAAHELRFLGNNMAHGDFVERIDADDADSVLDVMSEILNEVYQGPARVVRMRSKRTEKNSAAR